MKLRTEEKISNFTSYKKQVNIAISPELLTAFKVKCATYGFTMTEVMTDCMLKFIDQPDGEPLEQEKGWQDVAR